MKEKNNKDEKRKYGEGSIDILPSGKTRIRFSYTDSDGKQYPKSFTGDSPDEVIQLRKDFINESEDKKDQPFYDMTLKEAMNYWSINIKRPLIKESSYKRLKSTLETHIYKDLGHKKLGIINDDDIRKMINRRIPLMSHSSVKKIYDALNDFYSYCVPKKIKENPMLAVELPEQDKFINQPKEIEIFEDEEIPILEKTALLTFKTGKSIYRYGASVILLLNTGLRVGELLALEWDDINLKEESIKVHKTLIIKDLEEDDPNLTERERLYLENNKKTFAKIQYTTKTASIRTIHYNSKTKEMLEILKQQIPNSKYVIESSKGSYITYSTYEKSYKRLLEHANIKHKNIHATRHTFATKQLESGTPPEVLAHLLGHASTKMVFERYNHIIEARKQKAYRKDLWNYNKTEKGNESNELFQGNN